MEKHSHICRDKLDKVPSGKIFGYRDVVKDDYPDEKHNEDGIVFKSEVEDGLYEEVSVYGETDGRMLYKKQ